MIYISIMDDLIAEITSRMAESKNYADDFLLMNNKYSPIKLSDKNFNSILNARLLNLLFVDGGNAVLFESAGFCLGFIRVSGIVYSENKRVERKFKEYHVFIYEKDGKFFVKTFPENSFNKMTFDPDDESIRNGIERANPSRILSIIRRLAEIECAYSLDSEKVDAIILDGTLESRYPFETSYMNKLSLTKKTCSIGKTCSLTTNLGVSITKRLNDFHKYSNTWYYYPIVSNNNPSHNAEIYFSKLHAKSDYVFRVEIQREFSKNVNDLFYSLCENSKDSVFLGYPYGFVDVDQHARISEDEKKMLQIKFSSKMGKEWTEFSKHLKSMDAHGILDKIRF